ncbi:hypothetical protein pb186bvf_005444 [Paramecium bursaria]
MKQQQYIQYQQPQQHTPQGVQQQNQQQNLSQQYLSHRVQHSPASPYKNQPLKRVVTNSGTSPHRDPYLDFDLIKKANLDLEREILRRQQIYENQINQLQNDNQQLKQNLAEALNLLELLRQQYDQENKQVFKLKTTTYELVVLQKALEQLKFVKDKFQKNSRVESHQNSRVQQKQIELLNEKQAQTDQENLLLKSQLKQLQSDYIQLEQENQTLKTTLHIEAVNAKQAFHKRQDSSSKKNLSNVSNQFMNSIYSEEGRKKY